jgi:hypothetical protein
LEKLLADCREMGKLLVSVVARLDQDMTPPHVCEEQTRLLRAYQDASSAYWAAVMKLRRNMGWLSEQEYQRAYEQTERLRLLTGVAEEVLRQHMMEHGC